jgi:hypothetical protein
VPYDDLKQRFRIDLPDGWRWTPQPGDTLGEWFRKDDTGAIGNFGVRVVKLAAGMSLRDFVAQTEASIKGEPGYRKLAEQPSMLGTHSTIKREYVMFVAGSERTQRHAEEQFLVNGEYGFWLHFETVAEGFDLFQHDIDHLFASFVPIAGGQRAKVAGKKAEHLIGHWLKVGDTLHFDLHLDGTFALGDETGTYIADNDYLIVTIPGKVVEKFHYAFIQEELVIAGPHLEEPIHYRRVAGPHAVLTGLWQPRGGKAAPLRLSAGGSFVFGARTGVYAVKGDLLVLKSKDGDELTYVMLLDGDLLKLSGADFVDQVLFDRGN